MTLTSETSAAQFTGNGVATNFATGFLFFEAEDLEVVKDGVTLTLNIDYTVIGAGEPLGGQVILPAPLAAGILLTIERKVDFVQETAIPNQGGFFPRVIERAFDFLTMQTQELRNRLLRVPFSLGPTEIGIQLPAPASRVNTALAFDGAGLPILSPVGDFLGAASAAAESAVSAAASSAAAGAASGRLDVGSFAELATKFTYGAPGPGQQQVAAGDVILWRAEQIAWKVRDVSSLDFDEDYTGAGGIKLKYQRNASEQIPARAANADDSESLQRAINSGQNVVVLPSGTTNIATQIDIPEGVSLIGPNTGNATLNYTGTGTAMKIAHSSGADTRIYQNKLAGFLLFTSTGDIGIDILSLSEGWFEDVIVAGFSGTGIALHSSISGGAVYNTFWGVKSQLCPVGWDLYRDGGGVSSYTNDNIFSACRANGCSTVGLRITGGNHNVWQSGQIEACALGVLINEPAVATTQRNTVVTTRFENNTADIEIGAGVSETILGPENWYVNGAKITDNGSRTQLIGAGPVGHRRSSGFQLPEGSFRYDRAANGGSQIPHTVLNEESSLFSPVTLQIQSPAPSLDARAIRVRYGTDAVNTFKFGIVPISGKITDLSSVNGPVGVFTLTAGSPTTVVPNTAVTAASIIMLQPYDPDAAQMVGSAACPYISARTAGTSFSVTTGNGSNAAGTEVFAYWLVN